MNLVLVFVCLELQINNACLFSSVGKIRIIINDTATDKYLAGPETIPASWYSLTQCDDTCMERLLIVDCLVVLSVKLKSAGV